MNNNLSESARVSNNVRTVILGLFVLIGFIILVFAAFTAGVGDQLNQVQFANSVFIAAIVGAFTLVGVIIYQIRGGNGK
jgi:amino acid transporter